MSDHREDPRAEAAFRAAFQRHAADAPDEPLEVAAARRRGRWLPLLAAAAVLVIAVGIGIFAVSGDDMADRNTPDPAVPAVPAQGDLPAPAAGSKWVSWRDVAVQVPEEWVYDSEPGRDWCADTPSHGRRNPTPYVDLDSTYGVVLSIGCPHEGQAHDEAFGPAPERLWQTHLSFDPAEGQPDRNLTHDGWTLSTRTVGHAHLRLLTDRPEETDRILATATVFETDQNGCDATSPAQAEEFVRPPDRFDLTRIDAVDWISVCQYDRHVGMGRPALMGSRRIVGADADALLRGLQAAPEGGGPDRPDSCVHDMYGDTAVVVRLHDGERTEDVYVYYDWCFGNGIDDGTTRRALTADTCAPLFAPPVTAWSYSSSLRDECG